MEYFLLKILPIYLVYFSMFAKEIQSVETGPNVSVNSIVKKQNYLMCEKNFDQDSTIKTGDVIECEVIKTNSEEPIKNDIHVFTQSSTTGSGYVFYPASKDKKCFSFKVRTNHSAYILLNAIPALVENERFGVILENDGKSVIRIKNGKHVNTAEIKGIVNGRELSGFWIRWLDDHLLEVGRDGDDSPFLYYRLPEKISVNFIGLLSDAASGEWILHQDPYCGGYNITKNIVAETKCKIGSTTELNILQKSQEHILNQIKKLHGIFKASNFRSTEILLEYQQLIRKHFRKAEENQNKIYDAEDNNIYYPLKTITFDEITEVYFQFLEELQMPLNS